MRQISLITGGCRSGKSKQALQLARGLKGRLLFLATCPKIDGEMDHRICRHQAERSADGWETVEEEMDLVKVLTHAACVPVVLIDCLTLWVGNRMYHASKLPTEDQIAAECEKIIAAVSCQTGHLLMVTNEVGLGIVPENTQARHYRDLIGRCNQVMAAHADRVILMVAGIPVVIKDLKP